MTKISETYLGIYSISLHLSLYEMLPNERYSSQADWNPTVPIWCDIVTAFTITFSTILQLQL